MKSAKNEFRWSLFEELPVVGIMRNISKEDADEILPGFIGAGFTTLEVSLSSPNAPGLISGLVQQYGDHLNVGAGTVIDLQDLQVALEAGAGFIVTPVVDEDVIRYCAANGIPVFAGAFTPTEIVKAWKLGASMVKVFPADELGPGYIKSLKAPLEKIRLLPTGGISADNAQNYLNAGADGLGVSTGLFKADLISNKKWTELKDYLRRFGAIVKNHTQN